MILSPGRGAAIGRDMQKDAVHGEVHTCPMWESQAGNIDEPAALSYGPSAVRQNKALLLHTGDAMARKSAAGRRSKPVRMPTLFSYRSDIVQFWRPNRSPRAAWHALSYIEAGVRPTGAQWRLMDR